MFLLFTLYSVFPSLLPLPFNFSFLFKRDCTTGSHICKEIRVFYVFTFYTFSHFFSFLPRPFYFVFLFKWDFTTGSHFRKGITLPPSSPSLNNNLYQSIKESVSVSQRGSVPEYPIRNLQCTSTNDDITVPALSSM